MRLYHARKSQVDRPQSRWLAALLMLSVILLQTSMLQACSVTPATPQDITVHITADGKQISVRLPPSSTVQQALDAANFKLATLDRTEPPVYTVLTDGAGVQLIRVTESFEIKQEVIPFERQTMRNESLPKDQEIYLQKGQNGLQEITYRHVYEDGVETSAATIVKRVTLQQPVPEIVMVGIQAPFVPFSLPGKLVYLRDGNAWLIEESTANRRAVVTTGDLDGRVLSLSDDGSWLLFTRKAQEEGMINELWTIDLSAQDSKPIDLGVRNVVLFADWVPGSHEKVVFSTVEPRTQAPGWQANNDLYALSFSPSGWVSKWKDKPVLEANSGGVYGWWGTDFAWAPNGSDLAFSRPDGIGLLNFNTGELNKLWDVVPLQTRGDWAWVPGISWGADGTALYMVDHVPPQGSSAPEESPDFDLSAFPLSEKHPLSLVSQSGMFAYPLVSPQQDLPSGEKAYQVAYLQAIFPSQSDTSRYRLIVMDRDGSNQHELFPGQERSGGLEPQMNWGAWSPAAMPDSGNYAIALIYQGNLWVVDSQSGQAQQITGDGLTSRVVWK
jgi:hypothetical protein